MTQQQWLVIVACAFGLSLAVLTIWRGRGSPLAAPLALLIVDLTTWNFADTIWQASGQRANLSNLWHVVDHVASPLGIPLALDFVLVFVGRRKSLRWTLWLTWVAALVPSVMSVVAMFSPWARNWVEARPWSGWEQFNIAILVPTAIFGVGLLIQFLRRTSDAKERARIRAVLGAIVVLALGGGTEFLPGTPLGAIAYFVFTLALTLVVIRLELLDVSIPARLVPLAATAGVLLLVAWLVVFYSWGTTLGVILLALSVAALIALVLGFGIQAQKAEQKQRLERLAVLGKFSDQLAHNLKNPIAALKGAAQFFDGELKQGRSLEEQRRLTELLLEQVNRLQNVVEDYRRLGRVDPVLGPVQLNSVVNGVLGLQSFIDPGRVQVQAQLDESLPVFPADPYLLAQALENLLRNAVEAMPQGGSVTVSTGREGKETMVLSVRDTGHGMDARTLERLQEFHTTKPGGTGLGLAHARRVAEAHQGTLRIKSRVGHGTTVTLVFPVSRDANV